MLASQNTLYAVRLALRFRVWLGTARAWLPRVSLLFFLAGVGAKSVLSIIPSSPRISTSFCHTSHTRKVQPKEPCPNYAPGTARDPCPGPDGADGPRALQHPRASRCSARGKLRPTGSPREATGTRRGVLTTSIPPERHATCAARPPAARPEPSRRPPAPHHLHHPHTPRGATRRFVYGPRPNPECTHYQGTTLV